MSAIDPYRNLSHCKPIVRALAVQVYEMTRKAFPFIWIGRGYDPSSAEHKLRALDIIVVPPKWLNKKRASGEYHVAANALVAWLISNADAMHVRHIIYYKKIWKRRYRTTNTAWTPLARPANAGISDSHYDHIHVYFDDDGGYVPNIGILGGSVIAPTNPPKPSGGNSAPKPNAKPITVVKMRDVNAAIKAKSKSDVIKLIQIALNANYLKHGQGRMTVDGYWGDISTRVYSGWQRYCGYRGKDANGIPGASSLSRLLGFGVKAI